MSRSLTKRIDIELLRILAVSMVFLYHAGVPGFEAGYLGVDIFLVISGFLVTKSALSTQGRAHLKPFVFLSKRIQRIAPAMLLVLTSTLAASYFFLPPQALQEAAVQALASSIFATNFLLSMSNGYFSASAAAMPFTHLWSIALEVQFYIILAILVFCVRVKKHLFACIAFCTAASLFLTLISHNSISTSPYLLIQYRFWEFGLGSLISVASLHSRMEHRTVAVVTKAFVIIIATVIIGFALIFTKTALHNPGYFLLLPCLATCLVVATPNLKFQNALSKYTDQISFLGASAFPLYLWHQPIFSLAKYSSINISSPIAISLIAILSVALAFSTHWLIDKKSKISVSPATPGKLVSCVFLSILTAFLAVTLTTNQGKKERLPDYKAVVLEYFKNSPPEYQYFRKNEVLQKLWIECDYMDNLASLELKPHYRPRPQIDKDCFTKQTEAKPTVMLWGSSHAMHLRFGIEVSLSEHMNVLQVASSGCPPAIGNMASATDYCQHSNWFAQETIREEKPEIVIIAGLKDYSKNNMLSLSRWLKDNGAKKVIIVGPAITWNAPLPQLLINDLTHKLDYPKARSLSFSHQTMRQDNLAKQSIAKVDSVYYASFFDAFCNDEGCETYFNKDFLRNIVSWDQGHLTDIGSEMFFNRQLAPAIMDALLSLN